MIEFHNRLLVSDLALRRFLTECRADYKWVNSEFSNSHFDMERGTSRPAAASMAERLVSLATFGTAAGRDVPRSYSELTCPVGQVVSSILKHLCAHSYAESYLGSVDPGWDNGGNDP